MTKFTAYIFRTLAFIACFLAFATVPEANARFLDNTEYNIPGFFQKTDTVPHIDSTRFPISDRRGDPFTYRNRNTLDLKDTSFVKRNIIYDPKTNQYYVIEKIGSQYYRVPATFSMKEFVDMQGRQDENDYFRQRANLLTDLNRRNYKPKFNFAKDWVNRITGVGKIDIRPSGYVDIMAGYQGQNVKNPTLPERARKNGGLDYQMNSQLQVDASIGDKIRLPINYNTLATFDYENQLKLDYHGRDDEILKEFQAGNVSFNSKGTLIPGAQSLFGVKTQLQFGKLYVTALIANQRSQRQSLGIQGSGATQSFKIRADEYEENRHFLIAQYFRNNYNKAMAQLPLVNSAIQIKRMEVWVTNRMGSDTNVRDVVGLMDLGENKPFGPYPGVSDPRPSNSSNSLYATILSNPAARNSTLVQTILRNNGLQPVQDFEKTFARKLAPTEYYFNPQVGFLSLNQPLLADEVLAVAYEYTYNGRVYKVGEFSQDVPPDSTGTSQKVLFLKLLKATSQRTNLPIWDLMMKNVYSVGYGQLEKEDFKLDVVYEEPSLGQKRYMPLGDIKSQYRGQPLLTLLNLDRLNNQNDPQPDGVFDYIEGFTAIGSQSRIIFPLLEPFGHDLDSLYDTQDLRDKYLYYPLYDTIKAIAQTYANLDRFELVGKSKTSTNADYQLGYNIPKGSVTVTANGQILRENIDYEINYDLGTLHITNQAVINSGIPVQVQFENNASFGLQQKNYMALRLDYLASKNLTIGGTVVRLGERPFFTKQGYGDDPIRNTMYGMDFSYHNDVPRLTRWLDKLPFYSTKTMSSITAYGEAAVLDPGHAPQIGKGSNGAIYVDDFEGTRSSIDLRFPLISWTLASTPQKSLDQNGVELFPEADLVNDLSYGYNRGKLAWYNIEPVLQEIKNSNNPITDANELSKPETRQVYQKEIFPQRTTDFGQGLLTTFDMAFYPNEKGPYNFQTNPAAVNANGNLLAPRKAWGGIMRSIDQTDFETGNIEYIEFWLQDPFITKKASTGGSLYFNLGNISEDVLRDGKREFENGLPTPTITAPVDNSTVWGKVPSNPIQVTNAFSNDPADRPYQDVGFDGLSDAEEKTKFTGYLNTLKTNFPANSPIVQRADADPSADNFTPYRDPSYDQQKAGILQRYKDINNPSGNSPIAGANDKYTNAFTLYPDQEELNRDNTMNELEEYFQYRVDLKPNMVVGSNFITDRRDVTVSLANNTTRNETWYLFRIPIDQFQSKVGNIPDFKSIRFIRMFLTGFDDTVVCRFGKLELVRNQWRKYSYDIDTTGNYKPLPSTDPTSFNTLAVNIEENDKRQPVPYRIPPGVERQQQLSNNNVSLFLNEQALSMQVCNLLPQDARGVFKTMNLDLRQYGKLSMFIHAEDATPGLGGNDIQYGDLKAVIRIGNDFAGNYYEIKIPLHITPWNTIADSLTVWPAENNLDFDLNELTKLKSRRNNLGVQPSLYYSELMADGRSYAIIGNPNLGEVRGMMLGIQNSRSRSLCTEVWYNELRLSKINEKGGYAATGRVDFTLADLGSVTVSGNIKSHGFGTLEQKVNERSREDFRQFDVSTNLDLGKLLPKKASVQIPVYAGISKTTSTPEYDPYDLDIKLKQKLSDAPTKQARDSIKNDAVDVTTIKTVNFTGVKKIRTSTKKPMPWDISNIDLNYSYTKQEQHNPLIENNELTRTRGAIAYNYAPQVKPVEPFKRLIKSNSPWLALIKDFNFNYAPSIVSFKADVFRQFGAIRPRNVGGGGFEIPETYDKYFTFDRYYVLRWELTRSLTLDFNAINNARVDEPAGRINTKSKKDSVYTNFFKGGRNTHYHQDALLTYNVPTNKLPLLDWTTIRFSYGAKYDWTAASLLPGAKAQGNILENSQTRNFNAELNFEQLYNKSRFLRAVYSNSPAPRQARDSLSRNDTSRGRAPKIKDPNQLPQISGIPKAFFRLLTSLKRVTFQYNEDMGTLLPGYMDSTQILGMNLKSGQPGYSFIFGYQPDTAWINRFGTKGLLTHDSLFNSLIQQRYNQMLDFTAQITPVRDLNIDVTLKKTFDKQYSELYKDTSQFDNVGFTRLNPYAIGSFSISYISYQTMFTRFDPNQVSETFKQFETNRAVLSNRLNSKNPYGPQPLNPDGFTYYGYGRYAQDVLIPAFLSAYTKKDPGSISLIKNSNPTLRSNPFSGLLPKPNWTVTYTGLSRIPGLDKIFTNFTIRHGYASTLSMNSFNTALLFTDPFHAGYPKFIDTTTGNYIPFFLIPNITISEAFKPLIALEMTFTNQLTTNFEYRKSRQLSLSLIDYQLAENRSTEYTLGVNWRRKNLPILRNIRIGKKGFKLDNDVTFRLDYSLRDDATSNSKLDQSTAFGTGGQKVVRLAPSIDYVVNKRVNIKLYYEQNKIEPKIATTAPVTNTRAGIQIRISLTP
ncbi:MAG: cell surface protein SprA [Bacteroidetes bacterium]|nr:cell surface protein SprA [Bacteroidota bacterium]